MVPDATAGFPSLLGKHLVYGFFLSLEVWVSGVLAPEAGSVRTKFGEYVRVEEGRGGNGDYRALWSCWLKASGASGVESESGPEYGGQGETKKEADCKVAGSISKGTYTQVCLGLLRDE